MILPLLATILFSIILNINSIVAAEIRLRTSHHEEVLGNNTATHPILATATHTHKITIVNSCPYTIWPALFTSAGGNPSPPITGWQLNSGASYNLTVPAKWNGRFWARTGCNFKKSGIQTCDSGSCIGGLKCSLPGIPPVTLVEFNMDAPKDFYDVSNVDGSNIPVMVIPSVPGCKLASCPTNLNPKCPAALQYKNTQGVVVGCKSACLQFNLPQYCCSGVYSSPQMCTPTNYSRYFKSNCPKAYSYAYDDRTSLFTCQSANYRIVWCGH